MAQFDVCINPIIAARRAYPLVVKLQSDLITGGATVVVAPLVPHRSLAGAAGRLTPAVAVGEQHYMVLTNSLTSLPDHDLQDRVANLAGNRQQLMAAIDLLFFGV